jgi:hypothetical protein
MLFTNWRINQMYASYTDPEFGDILTVESDSLAGIRAALEEARYDGPQLRVTDEAGWTVGLASSLTWNAT